MTDQPQPDTQPPRTPQEILAQGGPPPGYPQAEQPATPPPPTPEDDYRIAADAIRAELAGAQSTRQRT